MKKKYLYNGEYYTEAEMTDFAKQSGLSFDSYISALGKDVKVLDAPYEYKGNFYTQDEISAAAKKKGINDDAYLSQNGIKKKEEAYTGGAMSSAASKIGGQVGNFVGQSEKDNALSLIQSINAGITKGIEKGKQQFPNEIRATPEEEAALRDAQRRTGQADGLFTQQGAEQFNLLATDPLRAILDPEREKLQTAYNNRRLQGVRQTSDNTIARNNIDPNKTVQKKDGKLIPDVSSNPEYQVKNQEQALENVSGLVKNKFFKNGKEALEYAENQVKSGIDPTGNETIEHAITKAGEYKQKEESALNGKSIIQNAIEIQLQNDPLFKKQYETIINGTASDAEIADVARRFNIPLDKLKTQGSLPQEVVGELVHRFISDPDIKQIAEDNPEFKKDFDNFTGDKIYEVFPEYADVYIKNTLSRARELDGKNNWFANPIFDKSKYMDNLAEEVFKDRPILLKRVKDKFHNNWEHKIETTGIVDDLATGARGAMSGMWRSLKDVSGFGESYSDRIRNTLKEQYGHVETPHQNEFRKVVGEASNFMGMVLAMGATGSGLGNIGKGLGVMNPSVASKAVTLATFFDDELNHAASIYPENPTKAYLRASLSTAFFLVAGDAIPASKITGFKQNITQTLKSLETKALDKQAKMKLRDKILSVATETLQGTAKGTAEMTVVINGFKLLIDRALGLDESSINNEYSDANLLATAKSMLFGLPVPSMIHGFKGINRTRAAIYEMASNPEKYKSAILKRFGSDDHRIADIDFIADFKKYLDSMRVAENEKAKMVFNALHAKRLREQKSPDAFMKRNHEEEIRAIEQEQQDIMDGKDSDAGLTDSQKAIKTAYENGEINEMMEAQIKEALKDPAKADQFIKEIAEQATGAVAPELGNAKDGAIKFFGETLTDFAIGKSGKKGGGESVVFEYENEGEVPQKLKPLMVKDENGRITITMPKDEADALQKRIAEGLEPDMELMDGTLIKKADIKIKDVQDGRVKYKGEEGSPTKESVTERLNINNPFYKKVEDALVKLGLIEKYNPETKTGDVIGGYVQSDGRGGFASGDMYFEVDGVIKYRKDGNVVEFDRNGNVVSENTQNVKSEKAKTEIEGRKKSIQFLKDTRDSDAFKYKEETEFDKLGNRKKIKRLKTDEELKESTNKINEQIDKAEKELAELVKAEDELLGKKEEVKAEVKVEKGAKEEVSNWEKEQSDIETDTKLTPEEKEKAKIESTAKALEMVDKQNFEGFKKYRTINGLLYIHEKTSDPTLDYIRVYDKSKEVGHLFYGEEKQGDGFLKGGVQVDESLQRKGIASRMYEMAEQVSGMKFVPDTPHSKSAEKLWASSSRRFGKDKSGVTIEQSISEAYHKAKADGSNPELVKAVEGLLGKKEEVKTEKKVEKPAEQKQEQQTEQKQETKPDQKPTIEQQVKTFGVADKLIKPVTEVANALFSGLKKVGLVAKESVEDWLHIGKVDKVDENSLDGFIESVKKELPKVEKKESKIQSWINKWNELKKQKDLKELDLFYNKVKVALNGYAQGKGVETEFKELKKDIEDYAEKLKQEQEPKVSTSTEFDTKKQPINKLEDLQDVGEKIGGAKKDLAQALSEVTKEDIENKPLSKVFPRPDFKKLVAEGSLSQDAAILLNFIYDNIPAKPRKAYRLASWAKTVQGALETTQQVLEAESVKNTDFVDKIRKAITLSETLKRDYEIYSETLKGLGFPNEEVNLGGYKIKIFTRRANKETGNIEDTKPVYSIVKDSFIIKDFNSMEEAINGLKAILNNKGTKPEGTKFDIYQSRKTKEYFIGKKGAIDVVRLVDGFKTAKEAIDFLKEKQAELQAMWDAMKAPKERRMANHPRVGTDWRKGENITSNKFQETFGFRGVEFGNWVNNAERQAHVNEAYDALMDLASVLGISPKALSLNGELGFAFGARGSGKANAHYEADKVVINLTKTRGAGSLAHEWWHALDNYFSRARNQKTGYITERPRDLINRDGSRVEGVRKEMIDAFKSVMDAIGGSKLKDRSMVLDKTRSEAYWSTPIEMSARSFENYIIEKLAERNQQNDYLANLKSTEEWIKDAGSKVDATKNYPYPLKEESHSINEKFQQFFETIKEDESGKLYQIIGEVGAENLPKIKANLDVARQMEAGGKTPKEIWLATGWERTKDKGKWKYDLPDFLQGASDLFDLEDKRDGEIITNAGFVVSSELRKAYPQLANIPVRINISRNNNPRGSFERVEINGKRKKDHDQINVYARDVAEAQSILIHEIQHAIQEKEGFAKGGSPRQFEIDNVTKIVIDVFEQEGSKQKAKDRIERLMKANNPEYMDSILFVLDSVSEEQLNQIIKDNKLSKEERYKRLAGEVEARNAEKRLTMTPEQRREQMLSETEDVAEDSKIYIYGANEEKTIKVDGKDVKVRTLPEGLDIVNGFYSPLEKTIRESKTEKWGSGKQAFAELKGIGLKADEVKWTGLEEWLTQQGKVTKQGILDYLKNNRVELVEVVKSAEEKQVKYKQLSEMPNAIYGYAERFIETGDKKFLSEIEKEGYKVHYDNNGEVDYFTKEGKTYLKDTTKFSQYQLEGEKENYREVLVTMPKKVGKGTVEQNEDGTFSIRKTDGTLTSKKWGAFAEADEYNERAAQSMATDFKSSHFDEPNILVHLRMNTRVDSEGKKVLFIEEIQSDWGQKGKKEGFVSKEIKELPKEYEINEPSRFHGWLVIEPKGVNGSTQDVVVADEPTREEAVQSAIKKLNEKLKERNIPSAPFVTDTNAWTKLGLKVALKEAVAQGADKIAWTTGEQQNERYDLSKQVDWINAEKTKKGDYKIEVGHKDGRPMETLYLKETELEANLGKELATKIVNDGGGMYKGLDLQVGGSGMKGFYGSPTEGKLGIVGNVAKKLFGQEPKTIDVFQSDKLARGWSVTTKDINGNVQTTMFDSKSKGLAWLSKQEELEVLSEDAEGKNYTTQHSIEITPELKAAAEKGMPLFQNANAQYRIKAGEHIVEALKDFDGSPKAVTAIVHEFMHPTVVEIFNGAKEGNETGARHANTIVEEYNKANPDKKITLEQMIEGNDAFINGRTTSEYRAVQEFIAEAWEKYHHEGAKGFSKAFQEVLDAITEVFRQVYKSLTGVTLTPELRKMFDELLGKENVSEAAKVKTPEIGEKTKNKFSDLKEKIKQKQSLKIVNDEAENRHANSKLTETDNPVQEPNVKTIESEGENAKNATQAENVIIKIDSIISAATDVGLRKVSDISTDEKRFQGRDKLNAEKVQEIAENWNDADQDPIHVWTDPKDGKTYVLSGHHRLAAAKQAGREKVKVIDRSKDFTEEQAIRFAKEEANANRTMETAIERANTLRQKRQRGDTKDDINKFLDREGKNKNFVNNLSRLNPKGKTIDALRATEKSDDKVTQKEVEKIADWIGEARDRNKNLTDAHENELFDFLMDREGSKRITTKQDFLSKVNSLAGAMDFNANEPLNIARYKHKTEGEKLYDKEVETQKGKISDLQQRINEINDRIKNPNNPQYLNPDSKDYEEIKKNADNKLSELNTKLQAESKVLLDLYKQKGKFIKQGTEQHALFSTDTNGTELPEDYYNDLRDIIKDLKDEHKGITLDEIKEIAKSELGEYYSEPDIEAAYKMTEPQPPKSAPEPPKSAPSRPDKSVLTNIVNAENTPPEVKKKLTAHGLKYDPESHDEALQIARAVIDSLGIDAAVTEARARNFGGAVNTFIQTEALNALYKKEAQAKTAQEKYEAAEKFAEVSIALDEWARGDAGRGISALATFYQKSPLGMVLKENKSRKEEFNQWAKGKEESWDEFLERLNKTPEFSDYVSEKVQTELREERKKERSKFFKKVDDTLDKWINDLESGNVAFSSVVPPKLIAEALKGVKAAFKVGESATKIIGDAIDYISDKIGDNWDKDTFRAKIEKALNLRAEKTSVDRYADSLKKQIEELQKQIDAGSRNKNQSNKRQLTPEEQSLLDEKKRLQKELNDIDPKTTFAQRIQKQIDDIQRQIDAGKRDEKERKNKKEYSEEEKELQEKLKAKKAELEALSPLKNTESYKLAELDKFREKLKGLSEAEKDEVVSKAYKKLLDNGALDHADLREIIAKATGRGNLTEKQAARLQELNETINAAEIAKQKHLKERTEQTLKEYHKAIDMSAKAKRDLANEFDKKTDYLKVISSSIQGNTLGLLNVAVMNPLYNITTHLALRLPIGTVQSLFGLALGKAEMNTVFGKPMQAEFFGKGGRGFREAFKGLLTGMNKADYESKEIFSSQIRPNRSLRALLGKDNREAKMKLQEKLFHTFSVFPGATAETNFRLLNFGDKPMRYSASAATAAAFAKKYGIKFNTMDWKTFMEFPREIVKEMELAKGKSLKEAEQEAEYVVRSIEKEGERSTMQQDNFFSDMLEKVFSGGKHEGAKSLAKTLTISPFVKIPSNVLWLGYNLVHPQIALAQAAAHTIRSYGYRGKGEIAESKLQMREARYWMSVTMMGAALQAVMIPLIKAGIITAANDEDDSKKKRIADLTYQPQGMFNMTKFWAYLSGKNVNEVQGGFEIPLKYFGLPGALGNSLARDYKQLTPEQKENRRLLTDNLLELFDADDFKDIENGIFSSSSSLLQGLKGGDMTYYAGNMVNLFTNLIQPAAVSEFSRAAIPYRISGKFDSLGDKIKNDLSNRSALFRKLTGKYPKGKRNIWGEIIKKDDSYANRYFGFNNVTKDNFAQFIYEDAQKWDDEDFLPPTVSNSLGGKKLTAEQLDELEENIGLARKEFIRAYTNDIALIEELGKNYSDILGRDAKKAALQYLYQKGRKLGVDMFVSKHPEFENVVSEEEKQVEELLKNFKEINLISEDEINEKIKH